MMTSSIRSQTVCFACGAEHPHGLKLVFQTDGPGAVIASWTPTTAWEGFHGIIHGGIVSTVLDEAMAKAVFFAGNPGVTCRLEVRIRHHVKPGEPLTIRGWVVETRKRRIRAEAEIRDRANLEKAHAWAVFLAAGRETAAARSSSAATEPLDDIMSIGS